MSVTNSTKRNTQAGYKQTDVGAIPEDWVECRLSELGSFTKGKGIKKGEVVAEGFPCIRYGEIYTTYDVSIKSFCSFIPPEVAKVSQRIDKGDLLFAGSGETSEEIGKCTTFLGDHEAYAGGDVIIFSPIDQDSMFLSYLMNHSSIASQRARMGQGDAIVHIYARHLGQIRLFRPSLPEQRAIAAALSDVDALINSLNKFIAKKRDMKQAAMQELLSCKRRLPGFKGEWEIKRLGDIAVIRRGQLITEKTAVAGSVPVIAGGKQSAYFHNRANRFGKTITISGSGANAGYVTFFNTPIFASDCSTIEEDEKYCIEFIFHQLQLRQELIYRMQTGGAQPHIHPDDLAPLELPYVDIKEQTAIAAVLSDMDAEIVALEQKRDKTIAMKQGMMQELLTGKIQLV